jgi:hypothetical protein
MSLRTLLSEHASNEERVAAAQSLLIGVALEAAVDDPARVSSAIRTEARRLSAILDRQGPRSGSTTSAASLKSGGVTNPEPEADTETPYEALVREAGENARPDLEPAEDKSRRAASAARPTDNAAVIREGLGADRTGVIPDSPANRNDWDAFK